VKRRTKQLATFLQAQERVLLLRSRARRETDAVKFQLAVEVIACNLLVASIVGPKQRVAVPRGHSVMWRKSRVQSPVYGQHFVDALDVMAHPKIGLIEATKGWRFAGGPNQLSTIGVKRKLAEHLPVGQVGWLAFRREEERELIVLRGRKDEGGDAAVVDYKETSKTKKWRNEVETINHHLAAAPIVLAEGDERFVSWGSDGDLIDPTRLVLRRYFNNGGWNQGGRLFGGFWMNMPRNARLRLIRIGGERIANVDYGQLFPRLTYVRAQADQPQSDLYDIGGDGSCREGWKKLLNALLFTEGRLRR
jgi:hypothetical protein